VEVLESENKKLNERVEDLLKTINELKKK